MLAAALLIVCLSPPATVPPADLVPARHAGAPGLPSSASDEPVPVRQWANALGELRQAELVGLGPLDTLLLVEDAEAGLTAIDPVTGHTAWFLQLPGPLTARPMPGDGRLALACGADIVVVDSRTGSRVRVLLSTDVAASSPVADGKAVYVPSLVDDAVVATNLATGRQAWTYQMAASITSPAQLIGPESLRSVLVGCADGTLRALPATLPVPERERWVARVGQVVDRPVVAGGLVLVSSADLAVFAIDAATGLVTWKHLPGEIPRTRPVIVGETVSFATDSRIIALKVSDGAPVWEQPASSRPQAELQGALLCKTGDAGAELRDAATGRVIVGGLPAQVTAAGGVLVELRDGVELVGWSIPR